MKKRTFMTIIGYSLLLCVFLYFSNREKGSFAILERIPESKNHKHITPDGTVVEHQHIYKVPDTSTEITKLQTTLVSKHPIQLAWEHLDLAAIKRDYQKYTIAEMRKMWDADFRQHCGPFGNFPPGESSVELADKHYSRNEWLEHLLALGYPFVTFSHYRNALESRSGFLRQLQNWDAGPGEINNTRRLKIYHLPPETPWEDYMNFCLKFTIVSRIKYLRAKEADPSIQGSTLSIDGAFIPFSPNTAYIRLSPDVNSATFIGVELTKDQKDKLLKYGTAPKGINVVYVDNNSKPLPPGMAPRLYERKIRALAEAKAYLQQIFEDHLTVRRPDEKNEIPQQQILTPEPPTSEVVEKWFAELEIVHSGKLPKDLRVLRKVIDELEAVKRQGEKRLNDAKK